MIEFLQKKILTSYVILVSFLLILTLITYYSIFRKENINIQVKRLKDISTKVEEVLSQNKTNYEKINDIAYITSSRITIINEDGTVLFDTEIKDPKNLENHKNRIEIAQALKNGEGLSIRFSQTQKKEMIYFAKLLSISLNKILIRVSIPYSETLQELLKLKKTLIIYTFLIFFIVVFFLFKTTKNLINPIDEIIFASYQFSKGDFDYRIQTSKMKGEIKKLAVTLNNMAETIKQNVENLENTIKTIKSLTDNLDEGICIYTPKNIFYGNSSFCKLFEIHKPEGHSIAEVIRNIEILTMLSDAFNSDKDLIKETLINGKYYLLKVYKFRANTNEKLFVAVFYDIDRIKRLDLMKRDFIANFSHEIKTPLTVIKSNIETIAMHKLTEEEKNFFISSTQNNIIRIENIIKDIITLSFLESEPKLNIEKINILELIKEIISTFQTKIDEMNIKLSLKGNPKIIDTDRDLIEKILINLIDNAIKYNYQNGFININLEEKENKIEILIENSGKLIPKEYLERIFERFFTIDKSRSRALGGTGLGLSIVKNAVEKLGGSIKAYTTPNSNVFLITLPNN